MLEPMLLIIECCPQILTIVFMLSSFCLLGCHKLLFRLGVSQTLVQAPTSSLDPLNQPRTSKIQEVVPTMYMEQHFVLYTAQFHTFGWHSNMICLLSDLAHHNQKLVGTQTSSKCLSPSYQCESVCSQVLRHRHTI